VNAARLIENFERISEVPGAVPRLRRFILDLAVRGKLVEQNPRDDPATDLVDRIRAAKARLVEDGEIRKQQACQPIETNEVPFEVPDSWALVRLGQALELFNGRAFKPSEWDKSGLPIIRIQNLNNADTPFNFCATSVPEKFHVKTGDFLISWSGTPGTSFGAHIWDRGHAILNQHIFRAKLIGDVFLPPFLKLAINSRLLELIDQAHGGAGLQHITKPKLERLPLTLPPLAEQHRIVAKVDELMALCDRLEAAQVDRETRRDRLVAASLHRLNNGADADAFREHARFHLRHLPRLVTRAEHIHRLRQTIFNLAVRGQLVPQEPDDELASKLLKRIQAEREELIRARALKRDNGESRWSEDDIPFNLPPTWKWVPLQSLIVFGPQNGISPKPSSRSNAPRAITLTATTKGAFDPDCVKQVEATIPQDSEFWLRSGDLLFQRGNTREYVGIAAYYTGKSGLFLYPDLMMKVIFIRFGGHFARHWPSVRTRPGNDSPGSSGCV
jgi:type I restriction enzyme S subunit